MVSHLCSLAICWPQGPLDYNGVTDAIMIDLHLHLEPSFVYHYCNLPLYIYIHLYLDLPTKGIFAHLSDQRDEWMLDTRTASKLIVGVASQGALAFSAAPKGAFCKNMNVNLICYMV